MTPRDSCSICGIEDDDDMTHGVFGIMPVAFCSWCRAGIHSYCDYIKVDE